MSGLREALEKLADERDSVSGHVANDYHIRPYELRDLLAAHPAEPAPVVTGAAWEAAVDVAMDDGHNGLDCRPRRNFGETMRAALEAAFRAQPAPVASREALIEAIRDADSTFADTIADHLLAADVFRDEATVKAEALEEAARQIVVPGASSRAEDWLNSKAASIRVGAS